MSIKKRAKIVDKFNDPSVRLSVMCTLFVRLSLSCISQYVLLTGSDNANGSTIRKG